MAEALIEFGKHLILAASGLMFYSLTCIGDKIWQFDWKIFVHDNKRFWNWAIAIQIIFAIVIAIEPRASEAIKSMTGFDYAEPMAFFMTGGALANLANIITKDKIGQKNEKTEKKDVG